jgi:Tol biopolymer transport system component
VFSTSRGTTSPTVGATSPLGGGDRLIPGIPDGLRSPDWTHVAFTNELGNDNWSVVSKVDGTDVHLITNGGGGFAWAPDSNRIAFGVRTGLVVAKPDGTDRTLIVHGPVGDPVWSPTGDLIAYFDHGVHVVSTTGTGDTDITPKRLDANIEQPPVWSRDGTSIAYWTGPDTAPSLAVSRLDGSTQTFGVRDGATNRAIVWTPDGSGILAPDYYGYVRIDFATGRRKRLGARRGLFFPTIRDATFSPDGSSIAYSAGGECRDRLGIYVAEPDGSDPRRISNSCRIVGTDGPDVLHAGCSQVVLGLGGNDMLYADDPCYYFEGDTLYGGPGDDTLLGGPGNDILYGGPGNDTIEGGPGSDILVGGPGHDHLDGGNGGDTIYAQDGERDWITCGKPAYNRRAVVYADQYDVVSPSCEIVHRRRIG